MATIKPFQDDIEDKSLHSVWTKELYKFFRDFFSTVEMGPAEDYDEVGNPIIHREPGTGRGWTIPMDGGGGAYAGMFAIYDASEDNVLKVGIRGGIANVNGEEFEIEDLEEAAPSASGPVRYYLLGCIRPAHGDYAAVLGAFVGRPIAASPYYSGVPDGYEVRNKILLGTVEVQNGSIAVTQAYLAGSSNQLIVAESCE